MELNTLNLDELKALRKQVDTAITNFEQRQKAAARAALEAKAKELGYKLSDLTDGRKHRTVGEAKYANPNDRSQTWTGKGRQPDWFKSAIANGVPQEDLMVQRG